MTIDTFISKIDQTIQQVQAEMPRISDELSLNAIALIKNRIVDRREGIEGAKYSTKPMLATKDQFIVKSRFKPTKVPQKNGKKRDLWLKFPNAKKAVPVMILENGYKQLREIQGRQGEVVDLSYTGKMWQGVTIVARVQQGHTWGTVIGGGNQESQDKLKWMSGKYGSFLSLMPEEKEKLNEVFNARLGVIIQKNFQ